MQPATQTIAQDIDAELRFHLASRVEELVRAGTSPDAAREQALREFGDVTAAREELARRDRRLTGRRARRLWWSVIGNLRFGLQGRERRS